jgi:hypothetical protein
MTKTPPNDGGTDTSKIGQVERVDDAAPTDDGDGLGLSAEEQAQFDAMQGRESGIAAPAEREAAAGGGDDAGADDEDGVGGDDEVDGAEPAADAARDAGPADSERRTPKTISYGRHQRDLQALQAKLDGATAETAKEREARVRLDERTKQLLEAIQAKPTPAAADPVATAAAEAAKDPEPDGEADPIGHLQWQNRQLTKTVKDLQSGRQQEQQQTAAQTEENQIYRVYEADLTREAAADPAFADAFVHLRETRYRELGFIYADIDITDPAQCALLSAEDQSKLSDSIQRSFHNEQMLVARQALQAKKSPAKVVANLARARGFVPKAPAPANGAAPAAGGAVLPAKAANGASRRVAPADAGTVTDQLAAIRDGQEASRSLSDAGGSPGGTITPDRLANMSDDEFTEFYNSMPKGRFDQLMGKPPIQ